MQWVAIIGGFTAIFAATIALVQTDVKRIMAYSTVSQLGYMFPLDPAVLSAPAVLSDPAILAARPRPSDPRDPSAPSDLAALLGLFFG